MHQLDDQVDAVLWASQVSMAKHKIKIRLERLLTSILNLIPESVMITKFQSQVIFWKHYKIAFKIYWKQTVIQRGEILTLKLTKELYYIPLQVHDVLKHKHYRTWPTKSERIFNFCKDFSPIFVPMYLQHLIASF